MSGLGGVAREDEEFLDQSVLGRTVKWSGADVLGAEVRVPGATATPGLKDHVYLAGLGKRPDSGSIDHNGPGLPILEVGPW